MPKRIKKGEERELIQKRQHSEHVPVDGDSHDLYRAYRGHLCFDGRHCHQQVPGRRRIFRNLSAQAFYQPDPGHCRILFDRMRNPLFPAGWRGPEGRGKRGVQPFGDPCAFGGSGDRRFRICLSDRASEDLRRSDAQISRAASVYVPISEGIPDRDPGNDPAPDRRTGTCA